MIKTVKEWRVTWMMWPFHWDRACRTQKIYVDEEEAKHHIEGLLRMKADHPPQQCDKHVWDIKLYEREPSEWKEIEESRDTKE